MNARDTDPTPEPNRSRRVDLPGSSLGRGRDSGASAIEYALLLGLIAMAIIVVVTLAGMNVRDLYSSIATGF